MALVGPLGKTDGDARLRHHVIRHPARLERSLQVYPADERRGRMHAHMEVGQRMPAGYGVEVHPLA